jgi:hypothetical protein
MDKNRRAQNWAQNISVEGRYLKDNHGRIVLPRGVNMSACSKLPHSLSPLSFVGRPFPLQEAEQHLQRLHTWGLTFVRLLVPWEALGMIFGTDGC